MNPTNLKVTTTPPKRGRPFGSKNVSTKNVKPKQELFVVAVRTDAGTQIFEFSTINKSNDFITLLSKFANVQWVTSRISI